MRAHYLRFQLPLIAASCVLTVVLAADTLRGAPPRYRLTRVGTLDNTSATALESFAFGLNNLNQIVGRSQFDDGGQIRDRAFLWLPEPALNLGAGMHNLGVLGSHLTSVARDINDAGNVTGTSGSFAGGEAVAFLWLDHDPPGPDFHDGLNQLTLLDPAEPTEAWDLTDTAAPLTVVGRSNAACSAALMWEVPGDFSENPFPEVLPNMEAPPPETQFHVALAVNPTILDIEDPFIGGSAWELCGATVPLCAKETFPIRPASWRRSAMGVLVVVQLDMEPFGNQVGEARGSRDDGAHVGFANETEAACNCHAAFWPRPRRPRSSSR
jgi:hypothetical protein